MTELFFIKIYTAGFTNAIGAAIRLCGTSDMVSQSYLYWLTMIGQTISSIASPFIMCTPTTVAQQWFPPNQRVVITAICVISIAAGGSITSLVSPLVVTRASELHIMNYLFAIPCLVTGLLTFLVRNSKPPTPPSASASYAQTHEPLFGQMKLVIITTNATHNFGVLCIDIKIQLSQMVKNKNLMLLIICGSGISMATTSATITIMEQLLCPWGYSNGFAGFATFLCIVSGIVFSLLFAAIAEKTKLYIDIMMIALATSSCITGFYIWVFSTPHIATVIAILNCVTGATSVGVIPILMDLSVETSFPINEGVVGNFVSLSGQLQAAILVPIASLFVQPLNNIGQQMQTCTDTGESQAFDMTYSYMCIVSINTLECILLLVFCRPKYKRREAEQVQMNVKNLTSITNNGHQFTHL
ncbi:hypothetical protein CHUAL_009705 [Chamberlinius hualienensis]